MDPETPIFKVMIFKFEVPLTKKIAFHKFIRTSDTASTDALTKASIARDDIFNLNCLLLFEIFLMRYFTFLLKMCRNECGYCYL